MGLDRKQDRSLSIENVGRYALLGGLVLALLFVLVNGWLGWHWVGQPFPGFLQRHQTVSANGLSTWPAWRAGVEAGDVITHVRRDEQAQQATYTLQKEDGQRVEITLALILFTFRDYAQVVLIPALTTLLIIVTVITLTALRPQERTTQILGLYTIAATPFLAGHPDFVSGTWFYLTWIVFMVGWVCMPPLLTHFLLLFPQPRGIRQQWPFLLPLIYLPIIPLLLRLPNLLDRPVAAHEFEHLLDLYVYLYTGGGWLLLVTTYRLTDSDVYKKSAFLLVGLTIPLILYFFILLNTTVMAIPFFEVEPIHDTLRRYVYGAIPLTILLTILRYEIFGPNRSSYQQIFYITTLGLLGALCVLLIALGSSLAIGPRRLGGRDTLLIVATMALFFLLRLLYRRARQWWYERNLSYSVEDYKIGLRILSGELLKVQQRRDLEALISWNLPTDFHLQSAELTPGNRPNSPYALRLPLHIREVKLGTLFLGPKIGGEGFTSRELEFFTQVQDQVALTLLSLELDKAIQTTEALTRLKSKFLANVTHELRTPLNAIINYIGFVLDDAQDLNEEQIYHLRQALHGAERLLELINNILDMSKIEAGQMNLMTGDVDLDELVTEAVTSARQSLDGRPVDIQTHIAPNLPLTQGDSVRLRQIILNLLSNATRFTEQGLVQLRAYPRNGDVVIEIRDTGRGIDPATLPRLFQGFTTAHLTDAGQMNGPGLGLPITKHLVELHGGQLEVESQVGVGTTFTINLPIR